MVLSQTVVDFVIVAFAIFLMIRGINSMRKKQEEAPAAPLRRPIRKSYWPRSAIS
jgi:large conductance mechanosensitive channel